jgi:hypothetical protein
MVYRLIVYRLTSLLAKGLPVDCLPANQNLSLLDLISSIYWLSLLANSLPANQNLSLLDLISSIYWLTGLLASSLPADGLLVNGLPTNL